MSGAGAAMLQTIRSVLALLLGAAILQTGTGLLGTFIPVRMSSEGLSELAIGAIGSAYFGGFILGALLVSAPVRRVGHIRAFAALAALMCCSTLLYALLSHPLAWALLRFVNGLVLSGLFVITESWLNERADNTSRGRVFALYMIANYVAVGGGQFLLPVFPVAGNEHFILVAFFYAACLLPVALSVSPAPEPYAGKRLSLLALYRISPLGVLGCVVCGLVNAAFYALAPVFVLELGLGAAAVSTFMGVAVLAGLILQWPLGKLSDLFDRRTILVAIAFASAGLAAAIALIGGERLWLLALLALAYGGAAFTIYGVSVAHANDFLSPSQMVPASAGLLIAYGVGAVAGPSLGAAAMTAAGAPGLFGYIGAVFAALGLFGLYRMTVRPPVPKGEQIPFVAVPRTSPVIGGLDPRAEPPAPDQAATAKG
jgi:MFS family permease